ncbi:MAG: glycosyltransferase family 4 protein [Anaerolineales bacterium]
MRIGFDVRYLSHGLVGGVHIYVKHIVGALIEATAASDQLILYADTKRPFEIANLPPHVTVRYRPYHNLLSSLYNDWFLQQAAARDEVEVMHYPANYGFGPKTARVAMTLHDEINLLPLAEIFRGRGSNWTARKVAMSIYLHLCSVAAARRASTIVTISEYSRGRIAEVGRLDKQKIALIHYGCPVDIHRIEDVAVLAEVRSRLELTRPFILADAFKNPAVILRAWRLLPPPLREGREIIFFSRSPDVLSVVHAAVQAGYARLFVRPPRTVDLSALFTLAEAFVFPSWIEGFGLPLLEAMTCGAPIIGSDRGSIPEVVGDAGLIMDAEDEQQLAEYLVRLFECQEERERLRSLGFARVSGFTWQRAARQTLELYQRLLLN